MNRRERRKSHVNHERWLVSFADFITLLFAFFVVLYASSKADQKKQQRVAQAIDSAFRALALFPSDSLRSTNPKGNLAGESSKAPPAQTAAPVSIVMGDELLAPAKVRDDLARIQKELEKMLSNQIADHTVAIQMGNDGLIVRLREAGFFSSGSATPRTESLPLLRQIAPVLGATVYDVRIEGHTDNVPIHNAQFSSNWELSATRATRIAHIFMDTRAFTPGRLSAAGYAEFHPIADNSTDAGRAENRRVDLVVTPRIRISFPMPDRDASKASWRKITD